MEHAILIEDMAVSVLPFSQPSLVKNEAVASPPDKVPVKEKLPPKEVTEPPLFRYSEEKSVLEIEAGAVKSETL